MTPEEAQHWYDNKQAVVKHNKEEMRPSLILEADVGILLAIHHLRNMVNVHIKIKHVVAMF